MSATRSGPRLGHFHSEQVELGGELLVLPVLAAALFKNPGLRYLWFGDFPGGPGGKAPCSQCRGPRFDPWSGN